MKFFTFLFIICTLFLAVNSAQAKDYDFVMPVASPIQKTVSVTAEVSPRQASLVQAPRDGVIEKIYAWPGQTVGNGAPLARLDDTELKEKKKQLTDQRNEFTAHLRRIEKLVEQKLVDADIWDKNMQKLAQIRAELAVIDEQIKKSLIRAPERGTVLWAELQVGKEIKGAEPIFWVGDSEELWLSAYIEDEYSAGLHEEDVVAIFMDKTSSPVLGRIDFISFGGPKGGNINLYIKAPRIGEIARDDSHDVLVPIPGEEDVHILPESVLTDDGFMFALAPFSQAEPNRFIALRRKPEIINRENGALYVRNVPATIPLLLNPPSDLEHRAIIHAYEQKENFGETYAAAVLRRDDPSGCGRFTDDQEGSENAGQSGSCGGGCSAAGGVEVADEENPENNVCLVPSEVFDIPEIATENNNLPSLEEMMGKIPTPPENNNLNMETLPMTPPNEDS